jgi:Tol biopolymer transport system component
VYEDSWRILDFALSPDGDWIALASWTSKHRGRGASRLGILPSSGGEFLELTRIELVKDESFPILYPGWTPDTRHILFATRTEGTTDLWQVSIRNAESQRIWQTQHHIRGLSVHPEGDQLALSLAAEEKQIWALENYLPQ